MRYCVLALGLATILFAQESTVKRDQPAINDVSGSIDALGTSLPADSTATATVQMADGESATLTIKMRGTTQTTEIFSSAAGTTEKTFSADAAAIKNSGTVTPVSMEMAGSSNSCIYPLPLLVEAMNNADYSLEWVGEETVNGTSAAHIKISNTFHSSPNLHGVARFTTKDIWIDSTSHLPVRISYEEREASGAVAGVAVQLDFTSYQTVDGRKFPQSISRHYNGTDWGTLNIQQVQFNSGLTDSDFAIE